MIHTLLRPNSRNNVAMIPPERNCSKRLVLLDKLTSFTYIKQIIIDLQLIGTCYVCLIIIVLTSKVCTSAWNSILKCFVPLTP